MQEKIKSRNSSFELLRIISIFMIILSHYNIHGIRIDVNDLSINSYLHCFFQLGIIFNHVFVILTGYFMNHKTSNNYKKVIKLILEMILYSLVICIIYMFIQNSFNISILIKALFPFFYGNWFMKYYLVLLVLTPILNKVITNCNKQELRRILLILFIFISIIPTLTFNAQKLTYYSVFIMDYFIGAYLCIFAKDKLTNNNKVVKYLALLFGCLFISIISMVVLYKITGIEKFANSRTYFIVNKFSPFNYMIAVLLVLLFRNIKINENKIINSIAKSVLGVYLIHDNKYVRNYIWNNLIPNQTIYLYNTIEFAIFTLIKVIMIFVICMTIDKIRIAIFGNMEDYISDKIYNLFCMLKQKIGRCKCNEKI